MRQVLIVVPCFNEANSIEKLIQDLANLKVNDFVISILIVNDGSTDDTLQKIQLVNFLNLCNNLGIGGAVQAGIKYAYDLNYDFAVQIDGDGQHPINELEKMLEICDKESADICIGSRFISNSGFQSTYFRRIGIKIINSIIFLTTNKKIFDSTSGFRVLNKKAIKLFSSNYPDKYPEPESLVYALLKGLKVVEVQVEMKHRAEGVSSISGFFALYYMVKVVMAIFFIKIGFLLKFNNK